MGTAGAIVSESKILSLVLRTAKKSVCSRCR